MVGLCELNRQNHTFFVNRLLMFGLDLALSSRENQGNDIAMA